MNRNRRILTILALAAFGAIIFFHYYTLNYEGGHSSILFMTATEKATAVTRGYKVTPKPFTPQEQAAAEKEMKDMKEHSFIPDDSAPVERVRVEYPGKGLYLDDRYPGIADVRMALFTLAVFYAGLFFILGEQKPRS